MSTPKQSSINRVKLAITRKAMTIPAIAEATCVSQPCVQAVLKLLREQKSAYVEDWLKMDVGPAFKYVAMHRYGCGTDKPKPPAETAEQRRARHKLYRLRAARNKIRLELEVRPFRHPQDEALFGPAPSVWCGSWQAKARVFRQPMGIPEDELETA